MKQIYEKFGIEIFIENQHYFLRLDAGEIVVQIRDIPISESEAKSIMAIDNSSDLYDYMLENINDRIV